ncbi:hypothetical protein LINPERPRIM_LOCUS15073 [Linum perenne]
MRWEIIHDTTWFAPQTVGRIFNVCCLLHNFIHREVDVDVYEKDLHIRR